MISKYLVLLMVSFGPLSNAAMANDSTIIYQREGLFDFAVIYNNGLYAPARPSYIPYSHAIHKSTLQTKTIPFWHVTAGPKDPDLAFNWHLDGQRAFGYSVMLNSHARRRMGLIINIVYRNFETQDSVKFFQGPAMEIKQNLLSVSPVAHYFRSYLRTIHNSDIVQEKINA
jgi:hypothetical protein